MGKLSLGKLYLYEKTSIDIDVPTYYVMDKTNEEEKNIQDKIAKFFDTYAKLEMEVCKIRDIDLSKKKNKQHVGKDISTLLRWKVQGEMRKLVSR